MGSLAETASDFCRYFDKTSFIAKTVKLVYCFLLSRHGTPLKRYKSVFKIAVYRILPLSVTVKRQAKWTLSDRFPSCNYIPISSTVKSCNIPSNSNAQICPGAYTGLSLDNVEFELAVRHSP